MNDAVGLLDDATSLIGHPGELAARFERDGALLLRSLLDPTALADATDAVARPLELAGWIERSGTDAGAFLPCAGVLAPDLYRDRPRFEQIISSERLHLIGRDPHLLDLVATLLGTSDLLVHPNPAVRVSVPASTSTDVTPAHQDHVGMQGTTSALTVWIPLVDCPVAIGPIEVALGSHLGGARPVIPVPGARVLPCSENGLGTTWMVADLGVGDIVCFHSLTVHRTPPNRSSTVRLSVDFRYQPVSEPISEASLRPPAGLRWEGLRARWSDPRLVPGVDPSTLTVVAFDPVAARSIGAED